MASSNRFEQLNRRIVSCDRCPRLRQYCQKVARDKRAAFHDQTYFGKPVPNFGDADARLLIVGLAPAAHGANRTGRMFTGDRSGDFLFRAMFRAGFANQATGTDRHDGLKLIDAVITAAAHCAPPANKPNRDELQACSTFLDETFNVLARLRVVMVLGALACNSILKLYQRRSWIDKMAPYRFAHGAEHRIDGAPVMICSYHPSQQNTFTGRLTDDMLFKVFKRARRLIDRSDD